MTPLFAFFLLTGLGFLFILLEILLPGGIIGFIGTLLLVAAAAVSFPAFGGPGGFFASMALLFGGGFLMWLWLKVFPRTWLGRSLTLSNHVEGGSHPDQSGLMGAEGMCLSDLRPAGLARIAGEKHDVVAESGWIEAGRKIRVVKVSGGVVTVRAGE